VDPRARERLARQLMDEYAVATGLTGALPPRRYLWTDAFAVCNFLGIYRASGDGRDLDCALRLVDQVHHVLGRHRQDDSRKGWISGLAEEEGERHPTRGGLRIGKELPERSADEPFDARLEWDRDGQYFHYLTQWMHALHRVGQEMDQPIFHCWAVELAESAHAHFTRSDSSRGPQRMVWKMSIDLSRPLAPSMGQHDPLDALLSYLELQTGATPAAKPEGDPNHSVLEREIAEASALCAHAEWATDDPLGTGALLTGVFRLADMITRHGITETRMMSKLVAATGISLEAYTSDHSLDAPAESRLAFRELGLAIGLRALERTRIAPVLAERVREGIHTLRSYLPLADRIENFWSEAVQRDSHSWRAHQDINAVMLATSLMPAGYLGR
jgi:hypothetical protein